MVFGSQSCSNPRVVGSRKCKPIMILTGILREHETVAQSAELCCLHGMSDGAFYTWTARCVDILASEKGSWDVASCYDTIGAAICPLFLPNGRQTALYRRLGHSIKIKWKPNGPCKSSNSQGETRNARDCIKNRDQSYDAARKTLIVFAASISFRLSRNTDVFKDTDYREGVHSRSIMRGGQTEVERLGRVGNVISAASQIAKALENSFWQWFRGLRCGSARPSDESSH